MFKHLYILFFPFLIYSGNYPILIDTDVDYDDLLSICYMMQQPDIVIKGFSVEGTGWCDAKAGTKNLLNVLHMLQKSAFPVSEGGAQNLSRQHCTVPPYIKKMVDQLWQIPLEDISQKTSSLPAPEWIAETLKTSPVPIEIMSLSSLTNIAIALRNDPSIKEKIRAIYLTAHVEYEGTHCSNISLDPIATQEVLNANIPLVVIPEKIVHRFPLNLKIIEAFQTGNKTAVFLSRIFAQALRTNQYEPHIYFWDIFPAFAITAPSNVKAALHKIRFVHNNQFQVSPDGEFEISIVTEMDIEKLIDLLFKTFQIKSSYALPIPS
jgi:inosine-uridine nucleoside N-ribohydrolase